MPEKNFVADRVGAHLARQVHLQGGVDRHHLVLPADDARVVDVLRGVEGEGGIVVDEIVELLRAQAEAGHHLAAVQGLALAVDHART